MEYKIISVQGFPQYIENLVNAAIKDGFTPIGGICATTHQGSGTVSFYQAMVKYDAPVVLEIHEGDAPIEPDDVVFAIPQLADAATPSAIAFAFETLGENYESILLDLHTHLGRKVNKADVREIAQVEEVIHAD